MYAWKNKTKQTILFTIAWVNAIVSVMKFAPSCYIADANLSQNTQGKIYKLSEDEQRVLKEKLDNAAGNQKVIVAWDWSKISEFDKYEKRLHKRCGSCLVVFNNNSKIVDDETAAVVFNYKTVKLGNTPPRHTRREDQLYVWQTGESPAALKYDRLLNFRLEDSIKFNATMTLRRDSDFPFAYGTAAQALKSAKSLLSQYYAGSIANIPKSKPKMAVAIISNCHHNPGAQLRMKLITELEGHGLSIDKFGLCFDNVLKRGNDSFEILRRYKFYFAFENSFHCKDYITEKFFKNGLSLGLLPVVWGARREDYEAVAPPNSFIHADDFKTVRQLADYLFYLDGNDEAYAKYFRWYELSEEDMPNYKRDFGFCQICRNVHGINVDDIYKPGFNPKSLKRPLFTPTVTRRTIEPMWQLIYGTEEDDCFKKADKVLHSTETSVKVV